MYEKGVARGRKTIKTTTQNNMKKKVIVCTAALVLTLIITLYFCNNDVQTRVGAFKTELSKNILKSLKDNPSESITTISKQTKKKKGKQDVTKTQKQVLDDLSREEWNELYTGHEEAEKSSVSSRTADHEITAKELDEFHQMHIDKNDDDNDDNDDNDTDDNGKSTEHLKIPEIQRVGELKKRFPQAIIAGVKKCGTRALLSFLAKHPLVKSAGREMHFFDKNDSYSNGLNWYRDEMPESYENEVTIEKTPGYYVKNYVPKRIYDFSQKVSKDLKLIFIYRDPVERAISDYTQTLANKDRTVRFEKLVFTKTTPKTVNSRKGLISIGQYAKHLWKWLEYFPKVQMHFVNGDEFIKNPVPGIIGVQKFLDIPVLINEKNFVYNATKKFYCFRKLDDNNKVQEYCLGESKGRKHPKIKEGTRRKLTRFFKPHNKKFFEMIGKNFGWPTSDDDEKVKDDDDE